MTYSKYFYPQEKKIPLPLTILVVALLIFILARLLGTAPVPSRASKKTVKSLQLVNPTHNQMGVFWQTDQKETGWVIYGQSDKNLNNTASDERDLQDKKGTYSNHYVLIKNLQPDSEYFYKIVSNNVLVEAKNSQSTAFSFKTPSNQSSASSLNPAYGKILHQNGQPVEQALVAVKFEQAFTLLTLTKTTGEWLIPLNYILSKGTLKNISLNNKDKLSLEVMTEDQVNSIITTDIANLSPLPQTIILGKDYDFLKEEEVLAASSARRSESKKIDILFPREGAVIPGTRPLIKGIAFPGNEVQATIEVGRSYSFRTKADKDGNWTIVVQQPLTAGGHILRVTTKDVGGKDTRLVRNFSIAKSGEQVLAVATPESTVTLTLAPSPTDLPIVFLSPTLYYPPEASEEPTLVASPPTSGNNILPIGVASASLIILGLGILLTF